MRLGVLMRFPRRLFLAAFWRLLPVIAVQIAAVWVFRAAIPKIVCISFFTGDASLFGAVHVATSDGLALAVALSMRCLGHTAGGRALALLYPFGAFVFCNQVEMEPQIGQMLYLVVMMLPAVVFTALPLPASRVSPEAGAACPPQV